MAQQEKRGRSLQVLPREDISSKTVVVMLTIVIIVSILSLGVYVYLLTNLDTATMQPTGAVTESASPAEGIASITILPSPEQRGEGDEK